MAEAGSGASVLYCDVNARHPIAEVRLSGDLAAETVAELGAQLVALIHTRHRQLIVDGRRLRHVSPVCVGVLNCAMGDLRALGGELVLAGFSGADAGRLLAAGLDGAIGFTASDGTATPNESSTADGESTARQSMPHQRDVTPPKEERP